MLRGRDRHIRQGQHRRQYEAHQPRQARYGPRNTFAGESKGCCREQFRYQHRDRERRIGHAVMISKPSPLAVGCQRPVAEL